MTADWDRAGGKIVAGGLEKKVIFYDQKLEKMHEVCYPEPIRKIKYLNEDIIGITGMGSMGSLTVWKSPYCELP